jgi:DNA-directed RNA polymerase subunit beta'
MKIISSNDQENISENEWSKNWVVEKSVRMHLSKYQKFDGIVTTFASSKIIEDWSSGIVDTEDTVNYRTWRPKLKSIFCETIFWPIKDYECACGKYIWKKYKGIVCEKCGVELNNSKIRNIIMWHIELAVPIINPRHSLDLSIHTVLRMLPQDVEEIFATWPQALYDLLKEVDVKKDIDLLATDIRKISSSRLRKYKIKYLKWLIDLYVSWALPQDMMITKLPVIPPRFTFERIVKDDNVSGWVSVQKSSFNILYKAIIKVNNKIKKMIADKQPHIITKNKISHLQSLINYLFIGWEKLPIEWHENDKLLCFADYAKDLYNKREIDNLSYILKGLCQDVKFISNEDYNQIRISKIDSLWLSDLMEEIR